MRKWLIVVNIIVILIIGITGLVMANKASNRELLTDYNKLNEEYQQLRDDYENLVNTQKALSDKSSEKPQKDYSFIKRYYGMKYPAASGLRRYVGEEPLRIYPNSKAPYVYGDYKPEVVKMINEVQMNRETWCLVLDSKGINGYARRSDLKAIENEDTKTEDYGSGMESLGGFKVGDRIETLIGTLDQDYYLIYENGRIYEFQDDKNTATIDPMDRPFSDTHSLDAFVGDTNHIKRIRTDSPKFPLKDGFKVGDKALEVLDFYASKYDYIDDPNLYYGYSEYTFILEDGHMLEFRINSEELNQSSVITSISID